MYETDRRSMAPYGRNPGWGLTGLLAFLYGMGLAFGPRIVGGEGFWNPGPWWGRSSSESASSPSSSSPS